MYTGAWIGDSEREKAVIFYYCCCCFYALRTKGLKASKIKAEDGYSLLLSLILGIDMISSKQDKQANKHKSKMQYKSAVVEKNLRLTTK